MSNGNAQNARKRNSVGLLELAAEYFSKAADSIAQTIEHPAQKKQEQQQHRKVVHHAQHQAAAKNKLTPIKKR